MKRFLPGAIAGAAMMIFAVSPAVAQSRYTLPAGTVILVHTQNQLQSNNVTQGQTFETIVDETVGVDNYTVIPQGSRIRGVVTYVRPATRSQSGVIQLDFDRLTLSDGSVVSINGKLTSTDPEERRQIESSTNQRVVLVGGRGGIGAAIAGAGSQSASTNNIFTALGQLLSEGMNVDVPANTQLAVQLESAVALRGRAGSRGDNSLLTSADMIRAAQTELSRQNYYRGTIDGQLTYATQRAIFEYQNDHSLTATGNLDWRTARSLGLTGVVGNGTVNNSTTNGYALSTADATTLRRNAQTVAASQRQNLSIGTSSRYNTRYTQADLDLWFALSAFADNASLYEQLTRSNSNDASMANQSLINAARRVDTALQSARPSSSVRSSWQTIRNQLRNIDSTYY